MNKVRQLHPGFIPHALILLLCFSVFGGCRRKAADEVDLGTLNNSVYQNRYFGFQVTVPSAWSIQDREQREHLGEVGRKTLAGDDRNMTAALKASEQQSINLLTAFQHPVGTPVPFNPNLICVAEQVRHMPGIQRGKDYQFHARKIIEAGQVKCSFGEISTEELGGKSFDVMPVSLTMGSAKVHQKIYATIMKGYALCFIVSFSGQEEESALQKILTSVSFK